MHDEQYNRENVRENDQRLAEFLEPLSRWGLNSSQTRGNILSMVGTAVWSSPDFLGGSPP